MANFEKAKYDSENMAFCTRCGSEDDRAHWLICPRYQHLRDRIVDWRSDNVELPNCTKHHLLVPRLECLVHWRHLLCQPEEDSNIFCYLPPMKGFNTSFWMGPVAMIVTPCLILPHGVLSMLPMGM